VAGASIGSLLRGGKVIELRDWISKQTFPDRPWLLIGKGPTFSRRGEFPLKEFNTFALNHVVREESVDIAHIIDIDVVEACQDKLLDNCRWLIMPRIPNVKCYPSEYLNLTDWLELLPVLARAEEMGKLITYTFSHEPVENDPWTIDALYFSSELAMGILGRMGVKNVKSLGVDGGKSYSSSFSDLQHNTLLANGQISFDRQFGRLAEIAKRFEIDYARLVESENSPISGNPLQLSAADESVEEPEFLSLARAQKYAAGYQYRKELSPRSDLSKDNAVRVPDKIQNMEADLRAFRDELEQTREELAKVSVDLVVATERLAWSRQEVKEYKAEVIRINSSLHSMVSSVTWKVGRAFTKPGQILRRRNKNS
jgi:hypothetical protein